jgi:hypothetical protein
MRGIAMAIALILCPASQAGRAGGGLAIFIYTWLESIGHNDRVSSA